MKRVITEKEHLENKNRLAEIVTDSKTIVKVGNKEYPMGALTYYAKWEISKRITSLELSEANITTLIEAMAVNIPLLAEILAIAILRDRESIDKGLNDLKNDIMDVADELEWHTIISEIIRLLDVGFFFTLTEMIKAINSMNSKAGYRKMMEERKTMGDGYQPIQSLGRSAE